MKEIIILAIVFILGSMAIHFRQRLLDEKEMRELERLCLQALIQKKDEIIKKLKGK